MSFKLVHEETGAEIKIGDTVTTFRGEEAVVSGFIPPRHSGSTGRVCIKFVLDFEGNPEPEESRYEHCFFPSVVSAKIVEVQDEQH